MFIDIHTYCYRTRPPYIRFSTPEQLLRRYDKMKVDVAVILPSLILRSISRKALMRSSRSAIRIPTALSPTATWIQDA